MDTFQADSTFSSTPVDETLEDSATRPVEFRELLAGGPEVSDAEQLEHGASAHGSLPHVVRDGQDSSLNLKGKSGVITEAARDALLKRLNAGRKNGAALGVRVGLSGYSSSGLAVAVGEDADGVFVGNE